LLLCWIAHQQAAGFVKGRGTRLRQSRDNSGHK
jgi:hypothetical protein